MKKRNSVMNTMNRRTAMRKNAHNKIERGIAMTNRNNYSKRGFSYRFGAFLLALVTVLSLASVWGGGEKVQAAASSEAIRSAPCYNQSDGLISNSFIAPVSGGYMRLWYDGKSVRIEYLDNSFMVTSRKTIAMELPMWGGFYEGRDSYYLVEGQKNTACRDGAEVLRIKKYSKSWQRLGAGRLYSKGGWTSPEIRTPFDWGNVSMTENNGVLYLATGREGYYDPAVKRGHQGLYMLAMDEKTFKISRIDSDLWHSFAQHIAVDGNSLYLFEQSEGDECTTLTKYDLRTYKKASEIIMLRYGGKRTSPWAVPCYATVDDIALSGNNILGIGTSIDQSKYSSYKAGKTAYNIYLTITPKNNFSAKASKVRWLTNHKDDGNEYSCLRLTKINDNRFLLTWKEYNNSYKVVAKDPGDELSSAALHYMFIDGNGNIVSREFTQKASVSECHPIVKNGKAVFYSSSYACLDYYTIDGTTGAFSKAVHLTDKDAPEWRINGDTLYIYGKGTAGNDLTFKTAFDGSRIKHLVIQNGITGIEAGAFNSLKNITSVSLPDSLRKIGARSFVNCTKLQEICIPKSVDSIDSNAFLGCSSLRSITVVSGNQKYSSAYGCLYDKQQTELLFCPGVVGKTFTVPQNTSKINIDLLSGTSITGVSVDSRNKYFSSVKGFLCDKSGKKLIFCPRGLSGSVAVPSGITEISKMAFCSCGIESVKLPDSVQTIGECAFYGCTKLKSITFGKGVRTIGKRAFYSCELLQKVSVPEGVKVIEENTFGRCYKLSEVRLPKSVVSISDKAFFLCRQVTVYGFKGSAAEKYALSKKLPFKAVYDSLENLSYLSVSGRSITVHLAAKGGVPAYSFTVYYRTEGSSYWKRVKDCSGGGTAVITLQSSGAYEVKTEVHDSDGNCTAQCLRCVV